METKKFLDRTGVSTLWSKIKEEDAKLNAAIVAEDTARKEADNAAAARISANETNIAANSTAIAKNASDIANLDDSKQDAIDASHKLAADLVSFAKDADSKLVSVDVNAAILELENMVDAGGSGSIVNVVKKETAEEGYAATYEITQGGSKVGASINIPKDFLVKSAELKTAGASDPSGFPEGTKYIDFVVNTKGGTSTDEHIYLNVADLVDAYTADEDTLQMVNNQFSIKAVPMAKVTGLDAALQADAANLTAEITRATGAEQDLAGDIAEVANDLVDEEARADAAEKVNAAAISAEETRAKAAEKVNSDAIAVINGSGAGSIAKALADAKSYADGVAATAESNAKGYAKDYADDVYDAIIGLSSAEVSDLLV